MERKKPPPESLDFYEGVAQIYEDAKEEKELLKTSDDRERVYTNFVERLEKFVTREGKWTHHRVKTLAKRAFKYSKELFTFILVPGVEPTNIAAERALRPRVKQRKIWGCFRTEEGSKDADIMMSTLETMKKQRIDLFIHGREYISISFLKMVNRYKKVKKRLHPESRPSTGIIGFEKVLVQKRALFSEVAGPKPR